MRWNEGEVAQLAHQTAAWEGKLLHKPPKSKNSTFANLTGNNNEPRERWFKLRANCLFYFRLPNNGGRPPLGTEPMGVLMLEHCHVQPEGFESASAFSIIFNDISGSKKHVFNAETERHSKQWQNALKQASYQHLREKLINLQITLRQKTGCDPLRGTAFENNPLFSPSHEKSSSGSSIFFDLSQNEAPKPKPRNKAKPKSNFTSHVVENWEDHSPLAAADQVTADDNVKKRKGKPTFQSHVPVGNLLDL